MSKCWLYIYENIDRRAIYIGIGDSMSRVFGPHNPEATALRDTTPGTVVLQTYEPFSSRSDARKAEAIAIHIAALAGLTAHTADDADGLVTTNISGTQSSQVLGPAIVTRDETVEWSDIRQTLVVTIAPHAIPGHLAPFGANDPSEFSLRANRWWNVRLRQRPKVHRLIAVLKGSGSLVLGCWEVDQAGEWRLIPDSENQPKGYRTRVEVPLVDPADDNVDDLKGKRIVGFRANSAVRYSDDIR